MSNPPTKTALYAAKVDGKIMVDTISRGEAIVVARAMDAGAPFGSIEIVEIEIKEVVRNG